MTKILKLAAEARDRAGKGTARATRRAGRVPAVIYGDNQAPTMISLELREFRKIYNATFLTHLYDLELDGKAHRVVPRDVQLDPVTDIPLHVDFLRVGATTKITVAVPVEFVNAEKAPGIKRGGMLNVVRHDIELSVSANDIPERIVIDLTGAEIGDSIHISQVKLPEGAQPTIADRDFTVATVAAPSAVRSEAAEAATAEAPEA